MERNKLFAALLVVGVVAIGSYAFLNFSKANVENSAAVLTSVSQTNVQPNVEQICKTVFSTCTTRATETFSGCMDRALTQEAVTTCLNDLVTNLKVCRIAYDTCMGTTPRTSTPTTPTTPTASTLNR